MCFHKKRLSLLLLLFLVYFLVFDLHVASARYAWNWVSDSSIVSGLPDIGVRATPTVCYDLCGDAQWVLISGSSTGIFSGYKWSGSTWIVNSTVVSGLGDVGDDSSPSVGYNVTGDGTWVLISGEYENVFNGYTWDGTTWVSNATVVNGLSITAETWNLIPALANNLRDDGKWVLISGEYYGVFYGFYWNGSQWESDSSLVSGLGDIGIKSTLDIAFNVTGDGRWILIAADDQPTWRGFYWSGSAWVVDNTPCDGLVTGARMKPCLFFNLKSDDYWHMISGQSNGTFVGYYMDSHVAESGDLVITSDTLWDATTVFRDGDITVNSPATLTILNSDLYLFISANGEHGITVQDGASLNITGNSKIEADSTYRMFFKVYGRLYTSGSVTIKDCGWNTTPNTGLYFNTGSNEVRLRDAIISNGYCGIEVAGGTNVQISNTTITSMSRIGIWVTGGSPTITSCTLSSCLRGIVTQGTSRGTISNIYMSTIAQEGVWIYGSSNFTVINLSGSTATTYLYASENGIFRAYNCNIYGNNHGSYLSESSRGYYYNVTSKGGYYYSWYIASSSTATIVNSVANASKSGISITTTNPATITITNVTCKYNVDDGFCLASNTKIVATNLLSYNNTNGLRVIAGAMNVNNYTGYYNTKDLVLSASGILYLKDSAYSSITFTPTTGNLTRTRTITINQQTPQGLILTDGIQAYDTFNATKRSPDLNKKVPITYDFRNSSNWINVTTATIETSRYLIALLDIPFTATSTTATFPSVSAQTLTVLVSESAAPYITSTDRALQSLFIDESSFIVVSNTTETIVFSLNCLSNLPSYITLNNVELGAYFSYADFFAASGNSWFYNATTNMLYLRGLPNSLITFHISWMSGYAGAIPKPPPKPQPQIEVLLPFEIPLVYVLMAFVTVAVATLIYFKRRM